MQMLPVGLVGQAVPTGAAGKRMVQPPAVGHWVAARRSVPVRVEASERVPVVRESPEPSLPPLAVEGKPSP